MNKIILFVAVLLFISNATVAQSSGEDIDNNTLNPAAMLDQLDMSEISTGILIDRSFLFSNHATFYKDSTGVANYSSWKQIYLEIFNAQLTPHHFPHLDTVKEQVNQEIQKGFIPVLITDIAYHQITPTAFQDSLLIMEDGVVKDVFPRTQSPYQTQRVINFTPSTDVIFQSEMTFLVSKKFFFSNQSEIPQTVEIDFADGLGYRVVNWEAQEKT